MSAESHSRRFDPRWLLPTIGTDGAELFGAPDASPLSTAEEWTNDAAGRDVDEALEQIISEGCRACPHCGAIVARDRFVLDSEPLGPLAPQFLRERSDDNAVALE
jgi:hypothetical protein